jgi:hypothetical protein
MAVATVKRYLVDPSARIRLHDLVHEETEKVFAGMCDPAFAAQAQLQPAEELPMRVEKYGALCEILLSVIVTGCYWGNEATTKLWVDCLQRIADPTDSGGGLVYLLKLRRYPALMLLYGAGLAAVVAGNYQAFAAVLTKPKAKNDHGTDVPLCSAVYPIAVIERDLARLLPGLGRNHTPVSDHLFAKLRVSFRDYLPRDEEYQNAFDRFEYLLGLVYADLTRRDIENGWWGPVGCFAWRGSLFHQEGTTSREIGAEIETGGTNWPPLKAALFGGSVDQARTAKAKFDAFLSQIHFF